MGVNHDDPHPDHRVAALITKEQAGRVAMLVQTIRTGWDTRAISAAIFEVANLDLADVTHAAIRCAEDADMQTPKAIAFLDAKHWRPTIRECETPEQIQARRESALNVTAGASDCPNCDDQGRQTTGFLCPHDGMTTEERTEHHRSMSAAARAAIRPPKVSACICPDALIGFVPGCSRHDPDASIGNPQKPAEPVEVQP